MRKLSCKLSHALSCLSRLAIENLRPKAKNKDDGEKGRGGMGPGGPAWATRGMRGIGGGRGIGGRGGLTRGIGFSIRGNWVLSRGGFPIQ